MKIGVEGLYGNASNLENYDFGVYLSHIVCIEEQVSCYLLAMRNWSLLT